MLNKVGIGTLSGLKLKSVFTVGMIMACLNAAYAQPWNTTGSGSSQYIYPTLTTTKVGIGITSATSPSAMLQVAGTGTGIYEMRVGTGTIPQKASLDVITNHDSFGFQVWDDNNLITPRFVVKRSGQVGIGTAAPLTLLEVAGGGLSSGAIRTSQGFMEIDGLNASAAVNGGTNNFRLGFAVSGKLGFNLQGIERFTMLTNGNVGVNISNLHGGIPASAFEVNGNSVEGGAMRISNGYFEADGVDAAASSAGGTNNFRLGFPASGRLGYNLQGVERMSMLTSGNVGIANIAPQATLHVGAPSGSWTLKLGGLHPGGAGITLWNGVPFATSTTAANTAEGGFLIYTDQDGVNGSNVHSFDIGARDFADFWNGGSQLRFLTSDLAPSSTSPSAMQTASVRMVVDRKGNVGVGTSTPAAKFEMAGGGALNGAIRASQGFLEIDGLNPSASMNGGTNNFRLGFATSGKLGFNLQGTERFTMMTNGNIGVNISNLHGGVPVSAFEVNGNAVEGGAVRISNGYFEADGVDAAATSSGGTNNLRIGWPASGRVGFNLQGSEVMTMNTSGQVGIGTTSPQAGLHIMRLNSGMTTDGLILENPTSNGYGSALSFYGRKDGAAQTSTETARIVGEGSFAKLKFYTRNGSGAQEERMSIDQNGTVAVAATLSAGSITTKVWSIAPDYVFEKDYKLAPLEHVENYLDKNKHLPEMPSAKEMKEKGMDLAEMNLKLLKKVEELTLYAIQQEKLNAQTSKEVATLKQTISRMQHEK